jgi:hypothetical protein
MFSNFEDFRSARVAASAWRRREQEIASLQLPSAEEFIYRQALRAPVMHENEERRLFFLFQDQVQHYRRSAQRPFLTTIRPDTPAPTIDPEATESEPEDDDEDAIQFVSVALEDLDDLLPDVQEPAQASPTPTAATASPPSSDPPTPTAAASRKRGREDEDSSPEPVAKRTRSHTRAAEIFGVAEHGESSGA